MKAIKSELQSVVWDELFSGLSTEQCWLAFKQQIEGLQWKYIPVKGWLNKSKKPIWMTNKALRAVRQRRRYKSPGIHQGSKVSTQVNWSSKEELRGTVSTKNQGRPEVFLPARRYASAGNSDRNVSVCPSVCLSVRLSRAGIVSKRRKLAAWFLHHLVVPWL